MAVPDLMKYIKIQYVHQIYQRIKYKKDALKKINSKMLILATNNFEDKRLFQYKTSLDQTKLKLLLGKDPHQTSKIKLKFYSKNQMNIELDSQYKKFCHIQSIKPGHLKIPFILILIFFTLLTLGGILILYWKWQRFRNFIHLLIFNEVESDSLQVSHYLIVDSLKLEGKSRNTIYRNLIVSPYLVQKQRDHRDQKIDIICKYIEHKNLKYVIQNNTLKSIKFRINRDLEDYARQGLSTDEVKKNISIYGQVGCFSISFFQIFRKIIGLKTLRFAFLMFAYKKVALGFINDQSKKNQVNQKLVSVLILAQMGLTLLMMLGISIFCAKQHNRVHENIEKKHYKVRRAGQIIEVKIKDLSVGDVVIPQIGQTIYFKGIICAITKVDAYFPFCIVNQKLYNRKDNPINKIVIESSLNQVQQMNIINAGSIIVNLSFRIRNQPGKSDNKALNDIHKQKDDQIQGQTQFFIIVSDNNYIQRMYQCYKESCYFDNIDSIRSSYDAQQLLFHGFFFFLSLIGTIVTSKYEKTNQNWIHLLFSLIVLCFPFNLALFCSFTEIISIVRLKLKNILVVNPMIEQIGMSNNLSIELSSFESLQYRGFIKRSRCNGLPDPQLYENKQFFFDTYRRTKEDSIYAFLGWIGVYNRPYSDKQQAYKKIFQEFGFEKKQNEYEDEDNLRITNSYKHIISIDWQELQRFPVSQMFLQTIVIKNYCPDRPDNKFFTITQGTYTSEECQNHFDYLIHERTTDQWKDVMSRIYMQGKKIKYICCKKLPAQDGDRFPKFSRAFTEKRSMFMGLLVFDQWPDAQRMKNLIDLDALQPQGQIETFTIKIFSVRQQNALIGYDHTLRNASFFHSMQSLVRTQQTFMTKPKYQGVVHIGNGILDQGSLLASDVSINKISESYSPADFLISQTNQVLTLFHEGVWALYNTTLTVFCLVLFNFGKIVGQLVLFEGDNSDQFKEILTLSQNYDKIFLIDFGVLIIPVLLLNLYQPVKKLEKKEQGYFFRQQTIYHALNSLGGLAILYTIEFIDHGFYGECQIYENGIKERHLVQLRGKQHNFLFKANTISCEGIVDFITVSFCLLVILMFDRQTSQRKARNAVVGMINKIYMLLVWIGTILFFQVPWINVIRASIVIIVVLIVTFLSQIIGNKLNLHEKKEKYQEIPAIIKQRQEQQERERVRRRIRPFMPN